jgi:hypothetical protein
VGIVIVFISPRMWICIRWYLSVYIYNYISVQCICIYIINISIVWGLN